MKLIRGLHNLRSAHQGCVATIGNFDGVHLGHQQILDRVKSEAKARGLKSTVMLFEPQPQEFFAAEFAQGQAPSRLMSLRDKLKALQKCDVDQVLCCRFDRAFSGQTAREFVEHILVQGLALEFLVVGDDFRFGAGREGDFEYLTQAGREFGFDVIDTPTCIQDGERISSTRVRSLIVEGQLDAAADLLGQRYCISGRVRHGDKIGREINVPTANLAMGRLKACVAGIYAVSVSGAGLESAPAVASVGKRPTVNGVDNRLEVHLLNFDGDLYGQHLDVTFERFIRPEEKYNGLDELKAAIQSDIELAKNYFERS